MEDLEQFFFFVEIKCWKTTWSCTTILMTGHSMAIRIRFATRIVCSWYNLFKFRTEKKNNILFIITRKFTQNNFPHKIQSMMPNRFILTGNIIFLYGLNALAFFVFSSIIYWMINFAIYSITNGSYDFNRFAYKKKLRQKWDLHLSYINSNEMHWIARCFSFVFRILYIVSNFIFH